MKYSLRSLMIAGMILPPLCAGVWFGMLLLVHFEKESIPVLGRLAALIVCVSAAGGTIFQSGKNRIAAVVLFLISAAALGALLLDLAGRRFMPDYHPQAELAPRDVVSRAGVGWFFVTAARPSAAARAPAWRSSDTPSPTYCPSPCRTSSPADAHRSTTGWSSSR